VFLRYALSATDLAPIFRSDILILPEDDDSIVSEVSVPMTMQCDITGKKPVVGNHYARRGKAKYLGGVGRKVTGKTKRRFKPNLQRIKVVIDGRVQTLRVCVKAIRSGLVQKPTKRKPFQMPSM